MMVMVPGIDTGIDEDEAPFEAIRNINLMLRSLVNKIPSVRLGPWIINKAKKEKFIKELPEDVDITEIYAFDFN